ncbi:DNA topoisomerase 3-alpha [Coemansia erecta]|uniref:DNA topoisomerase n=1 Tax=Coemansia erecta TaxID=147472 RepID=A0A9W8CW08_9FUNG|nr:DNA topoisomerase 3-alpha [Coemansia erecta]
MRILCVAEKPSQAKAVVQILSNSQSTMRNGPSQYNKNYDFQYRIAGAFVPATMTSVMGHLTDLDFNENMRRWQSCNPAELFTAELRRRVDEKLEKVAQNLRQEARSATHLYIWTDCDREGEAIGSEVAEVCRAGNRRIIVRRAHFSSVLPQEIHNAMQNTRELDMHQVDAVEARIELDLRIGAALTRFQTLRLQSQFDAVKDKLISYGPCQFPTLGFVVDQFLRVESFVAEGFWFIYLQHQTENDGGTATFTWKRTRLFDQEAALALYAQCVGARTVRVDSVRARAKEKWRPLPLTTVELQKCCARFLRISPDATMALAEQLYNQGFVSYPRTETDQFDRAMNLQELVGKLTLMPRHVGEYAQRLASGEFRWPRMGRSNDKAHPPIHPVAAAPSLTGDLQRVYDFVARRFLACCSDNAKGQATEVDVSVGGERFSTAGLMITQRNYLDIYTFDRWSESTVPVYQQGQTFEPTVLELRTGETTAPRLLREADLVDAMDKNGIGTDATHAEHIKKIIDREYIFKAADDSLTPSTLGIGLKEGYDAIGLELSLCKPYLRRQMERELRLICQGSKQKASVVRESLELYRGVYMRTVEEVASLEAALSRCLGQQPRNEPGGAWTPRAGPQAVCACPSGDGGTWALRAIQNGARWMVGCSCYPQCRRTVWIPDCVAQVAVGSAACPQCAAGPRGPARLLDITFRPGTTPPGVPVLYQGCVRGCDELINELFDIHGAPPSAATSAAAGNRGPSRPSSAQSSGYSVEPVPRQNTPSYLPPQQQQQQQSQQPQQQPAYASMPAPAARHPPPAGSMPLSDNPLCSCGTLSVQRTTAKEGANKGRPFFCCSKAQDSRCGFFQWADQPSGSTPSSYPYRPSSASSSATMPASYADQQAAVKPKCRCGLFAALKQKTAQGENQGREYYLCTKTFQGCGFVCWKDEVDAYNARAASGQASSSSSSFAGERNGSQCYKCGQTGHWARDCSAQDGGGGGGGSYASEAPQRRGRARGGVAKSRSGRGRGRGRGAGGGASSRSRREPDGGFEFFD